MSFEIRAALPADAPRCAQIHIKSWNFAYAECVPAEIIEAYSARFPVIWPKMLANNSNTHYVAVCNDEIIGITTINPPRDCDLFGDVYELTGLYLDPDYVGI